MHLVYGSRTFVHWKSQEVETSTHNKMPASRCWPFGALIRKKSATRLTSEPTAHSKSRSSSEETDPAEYRLEIKGEARERIERKFECLERLQNCANGIR